MDTKILIQEILNAIQKIVDPSFKYMMIIALKQVRVQIFYDFVWGFIFAVLTYLLYRTIKRARKWKENYEKKEYNETSKLDDHMEEFYPWVLAFSMIFGMIFFACAIVNFGSMVGKILNPEWYAIQNIVNMIVVE